MAIVVTAISLLAGTALVFNLGGVRDRIFIFLPGQRSQIRSIAVLPLANLSGDPSQDYFADGMTDELITNLAKISQARITSRTSVMHYKGSRKTVAEIARELNVDAIVEGTVQRSGIPGTAEAFLFERLQPSARFRDNLRKRFQ